MNGSAKTYKSNIMKRKHLYPVAAIIWALSWVIIVVIIIYIFFPQTFESKDRVYYEPETEQAQ